MEKLRWVPEGVDMDMLADTETRVENGPVDDTPAPPAENHPVQFEIPHLQRPSPGTHRRMLLSTGHPSPSHKPPPRRHPRMVTSPGHHPSTHPPATTTEPAPAKDAFAWPLPQSSKPIQTSPPPHHGPTSTSRD